MVVTKIRSLEYGSGIAEVDTASGRLRGMIRNGVYTFLGVKYADAERFGEPKPPAKWEGVRDALVEGPICPSVASNQLPPVGNILYPPVIWPEGEDCQTMKIWSPTIDKDARKPVMFWLHGGGHAFGSSAEFNGESMAAFGDVVVVASNHRLNCLALLDLEEYGPEYRNSCNLEFLDIIAALKWVRENIENFGGDPDNVTLFGHSGGGGKVVNLMQISAADGLYHKAIVMAGMPPEDAIYPSMECARAIAKRTFELLGIPEGDVETLRKIPYSELSMKALAAMRETTTAYGYRATWSQPFNDFFPGNPFDVGLRPEVKDIPLFLGATQGERNTSAARWNDDPILKKDRHEWTEEDKAHAMKAWFGDKADEVASVYSEVYPDRDPSEAIFTDMGHRASCMHLVDLKSAQGGAPCYMYMFCQKHPVNGGTIPWHGAENDFVIHIADYSEARYIPDGETERIQDEMCACWTSFARNGDPNNDLVPYIPASSAGSYSTIIWENGKTEVRTNHDIELRDLLPQLMIPNDPSFYLNG